MKRRDTAIRRRILLMHEAASWFVEHDALDEFPRHRLSGWVHWRRAAAHRAEYRAIIKLRQQARRFHPPSLPSDDELQHDIPTQAQNGGTSFQLLLKSIHAGILQIRPKAARLGLSGAAIVILCTLLIHSSEFSNVTQLYFSGVGEHRTVLLPDGSEITLEADTRLRYRLTPQARIIELERGGAYFDLRRGVPQTLVVHADDATITAAGTMFLLRRYVLFTHSLRIWVAQGSVEVQFPSDPILSHDDKRNPRNILNLKRGQGLTFTRRGSTTSVVEDYDLELRQPLGVLSYTGAPLAEVLEDIQRYTHLQLHIDRKAAGLKYSGVVLQSQVEQWIRGLPEIFPTLLVERTKTAIIIRLRSAPIPLYIHSLFHPARFNLYPSELCHFRRRQRLVI